MTVPGTPKPTDPLFISYRHSDGMQATSELAWLLRAAGIPIWRDQDDLPPGDTEQRLKEAIAAGLSGAVLVITPDVTYSKVIREVEAPALIKWHDEHPEFALGIANAVTSDAGGLDYSAPDTQLGLDQDRLAGVDQHPADRAGLLVITRKMLNFRLAYFRVDVATNDKTFTLDVQTRNNPQVYDRTGSHLDVRLRPSSHPRLPSHDGLVDLADTIGLIPDAVTRAGANRVLITGGAHLSVALAIGAALPSTRIGHLSVLDQRGDTWTGGATSQHPETPLLALTGAHDSPGVPIGRPEVAVYLDLVPNPSDSAWQRYLDENATTLAAWRHMTALDKGPLSPGNAAAIAGEAAAHIRDLSNMHGNARVHLLLRCPFPIAVLVGRLTNTLRVTAYEWDDDDTGADHRPRYLPTLDIRATAPNGVIERVHPF